MTHGHGPGDPRSPYDDPATSTGDPGAIRSRAEPGHAPVPVLAAVIRRGERYLVARRPAHKRHGGLWEFPGGKHREGETDAEAAVRELREELGLPHVIGVGPLLFEAVDPGSPFVIRFVGVQIHRTDTPVATEHDELRWCTPGELRQMDLAPADAAFAESLGD